MSNSLLIDDHLLLRVLLDDEPTDLRPSGAALLTTGLWYHRLCRALADETVVGSMSRRLGAVDAELASAVIGEVIDLPDAIELLSLRAIGWPMAELAHNGAPLNLLSLEALAVAQESDAVICLAEADRNEPLIRAAAVSAIDVRIIS